MDIPTTNETTTVAGSTGHTSLDVEELMEDVAGKRALKTLQCSELSTQRGPTAWPAPAANLATRATPALATTTTT
jgi:hypothetical protein